MSLEKLEKSVGYTFNDKALLRQALSHASAEEPQNNERMEFLGDRVLNLCIAKGVYQKFPEDAEGALSRRHAALVRQETLAIIAEKIDLGSFLILGVGEEQSGGRKKPSILSDAMEAVIAAMFIDSNWNLQVVCDFIARFWEDMVESVPLRDPKSLLQEWLQARGEPLPDYHLESAGGQSHERNFVFLVKTRNYGEASGEGASKQQAQQQAAQQLLERLNVK